MKVSRPLSEFVRTSKQLWIIPYISSGGCFEPAITASLSGVSGWNTPGHSLHQENPAAGWWPCLKERLAWICTRLLEVNLARKSLKIPFISLPAAASWAISPPSRARAGGVPLGFWTRFRKEVYLRFVDVAGGCRPAQERIFSCLMSASGSLSRQSSSYGLHMAALEPWTHRPSDTPGWG